MAAGIPTADWIVLNPPDAVWAVINIRVAVGIEIIPLEPEQRSYLRREAPSVTSLIHSLRGVMHILLTIFIQAQLGYKQVSPCASVNSLLISPAFRNYIAAGS